MWMATVKTKQDIPLTNALLEENVWGHKQYGDQTIPAGTKITITKGLQFEYALWIGYGIYDLPKEYIDESTINVKVHE